MLNLNVDKMSAAVVEARNLLEDGLGYKTMSCADYAYQCVRLSLDDSPSSDPKPPCLAQVNLDLFRSVQEEQKALQTGPGLLR